MTGKQTGIVQMLACAFLWSTGGLFMKFIPWHPMVLSGMRSLVAGIVIGGYMLVAHIPLTITKKALSSGVALAATYSFFVIANKMTTAANAIVLQFTAPVFIVVLSAIFLHAKFSHRDVAAVALTMMGIALFFVDQLSSGGLVGNIMAILSGIAMASMYIINGEASERERMSSLFIAQVMCFVLGLAFIGAGDKPAISGAAIGSIVFLGAIQLGTPYILYSKAAEKCTALVCCLVSAIEPLLNPLWVLIFYGERPGPMALVGGAVVIVTVTVWNILSGKEENAEVSNAY